MTNCEKSSHATLTLVRYLVNLGGLRIEKLQSKEQEQVKQTDRIGSIPYQCTEKRKTKKEEGEVAIMVGWRLGEAKAIHKNKASSSCFLEWE